MTADLAALAYLVSGVLFILALRGLSSPETSRQGNNFGMIGMAIAIATTLLLVDLDATTLGIIAAAVVIGGGIGAFTARSIKMTAMPQLVAAFHSLVGLAAVAVAAAAFYAPESFGIAEEGDVGAYLLRQPIHMQSLIELSLGAAIGAVTFTGSVIAFAKLNGNMSGAPIILPARHLLNIAIAICIVALIFMMIDSHGTVEWHFWALAGLSLLIGVTLIIPIGGADMPVVVSMLNSYSGWAAAALGFTLENVALIITGALVGSSGAILSYIMCKAMNTQLHQRHPRRLRRRRRRYGSGRGVQRSYKAGSADDAAFIMRNASKVIIVPGYGMASAQAQHSVREMADTLKKEGVEVRYAIHPVAGRMPGHMNVLLAEANVPYDEVFELEDINNEFSTADVAYVIGANDVTNPLAKTDPQSPIYGMPILDVEKAKTVLFVKRSMGGVGYAGVDNELFYRDNTMMLLGDAKKMTDEIVKGL